MEELDVAKNIAAIEKIKAELLRNVSDLFSTMASGRFDTQPADALSNTIIFAYILSNKLGTSFGAIDTKIVNKIKLEMLEEHYSPWENELLKLSNHISVSR